MISGTVFGLGLIVRLIFLVALTRWGTQEILGTFGLLLAIETLVIFVAGMEFHTFTSRRFSRRPSPARLRIITGAHWRLIAFTAPMSAIIAVLAVGALRLELDVKTCLAFGVVVLSGTVGQELVRYHILTSRPIASVMVQLTRTALWQPFLLPFLNGGRETLQLIVLAWAAASVLATTWGAWTIRDLIGRGRFVHWRYVRYGLNRAGTYYAIAVLTVAQPSVERFLVQLLAGTAAVGVLTFAQTLANSLQSVIQIALFNVAYPAILIRFSQRAAEPFEGIRVLMFYASLSSLALGALVYSVGIALVPTTREDYGAIYLVLPILLLAQVLLCGTHPVHLALFAGHRDRLILYLSFAALVASIGLTALLVRTHGIYGAAVASLAVALAVACVRWALLNRNLRSEQAAHD